MKDIITKAQERAAREAFRKNVQEALDSEIHSEALRIARRWVKTHKSEIEKQTRDTLAKELPKIVKQLVDEAIERSHVYIDT